MSSAEEPIELAESVGERFESVGLAGMSQVERCYYFVDNFIADFQNGGFWQYLSNQGEHAKQLIDALRTLGAGKTAHALALCLDEIGVMPPDAVELSNDIESKVDEIIRQTALADEVDGLWDQLQTFAAEHKSELLGPKTKIELWRSRQARGATTQPHRVNPIDLDAEAKRDATPTAKPCPVCGQPCPSYRKSCKRCGFPLS